MDPLVLIFLTSGLFLGWALGANDASNVFGTAVGTRMITWRTAAIICAVFVILGALISGAGTSQTLGKLGAISALPGAFMTALSAAIAVYCDDQIRSACFHFSGYCGRDYWLEFVFF